jgi:predicted Rossmann fold flavoprotein
VKFDVIIIGAGAAGLMCAIEAGKRGRNVAVLEHNDAVGRKIRISGGGRCNFTNTFTGPEHFISANSAFHKSALSKYTPADFIGLVRKHAIPFHEKKAGQLFCDGSSQEIIDLLMKECALARVDVRTGCRVSNISHPNHFELTTTQGEMRCHSLVIATGGLSIPKIGASDFGYCVARQFQIRLTEIRAGLVPLTFDGSAGAAFRELSGVSAEAVVSFGKTRFRENVLFTHRGLSGPAILQISSYWKPGDAIVLNLLPDIDPDVTITPPDVLHHLPKRLARKWCELYAPARPVPQVPRREMEEFSRRLHHWTLTPSGTEGYAKAEVTLGGVDTAELSSKTMESRRVPGLYFIGEVVDVTGQLGGFNFQWAWSSGFAAGQYV